MQPLSRCASLAAVLLLLVLAPTSGAAPDEVDLVGVVVEIEANARGVDRVVVREASTGELFAFDVAVPGQQRLLETALRLRAPVAVTLASGQVRRVRLQAPAPGSASAPPSAPAAGPASVIRPVTGHVTARGTVASGAGFSAGRQGPGRYAVLLHHKLSGAPAVHCVPRPRTAASPRPQVTVTGGALVRVVLADAAGNPVDSAFDFGVLGIDAAASREAVPVSLRVVTCKWPQSPGAAKSPEAHLLEILDMATWAKDHGLMLEGDHLVLADEVLRILLLDPNTEVCNKAWQWPYWLLVAVWGKAHFAREAVGDPLVAQAEWSEVAANLATVPENITTWRAGIPVPPGPRPCSWPGDPFTFETPNDLLGRISHQVGAAHDDGVIDVGLRDAIQMRLAAISDPELKTASGLPVCDPSVWEAPYARLVGIWAKAMHAQVLLPDDAAGVALQQLKWAQIQAALDSFPDALTNPPPGS